MSVLTPMWINFSISENEMQRIRSEAKAGLLRLPENRSFIVEIEWESCAFYRPPLSR